MDPLPHSSSSGPHSCPFPSPPSPLLSSFSYERDWDKVLFSLVPVSGLTFKAEKCAESHGRMAGKHFLVIFCYFFCNIAVNVRADLPAYCGKESYAYTPLRKGPQGQYTLKQVHVVIRYVRMCIQYLQRVNHFFCS